MDKRTIIFRADGGPAIGMGHFIRTLALAEMLNDDFHCVYATRNPSQYQIAEIEKTCHSLIDLPKDESHFDHFLSMLKGDEIVVLDNYYFDTDYQRAIKTKGCKLVCIDDIHDKHFVADIVINHAEGISAEQYSIEPNTKLLMGYQYALIRKEFRLSQKQSIDKKYACLVMIGGADPLGITSRIVDILQQFEFDKPIAVVTGVPLQTNFDSTNNQFEFFEKLGAAKVAGLMQNSEFGILPASTVAIEACASRLPFVCGYFVDNQLEMYKSLKKEQLATCVGNFRDLDSGKLLGMLKDLSNIDYRNSIIAKQIESLDNDSDHRFLKIFRQLWY